MRSPSFFLAVAGLAMALPTHAALPTIGGCQVFPANNYWNTPVDTLPVHPSSATWVASVGSTRKLHADWGNVLSDNYGIPYITVTGAQPLVPIAGDPDPNLDYSDESDPGPYPVPPNAPVEGGNASTGDRHVLVIETTNCVLYELYFAHSVGGGASWTASSFAKWPLGSNALRPADWTSADAAGLPIFPGLVRWEEVAAGEIAHAIRFTANLIWGNEGGALKYLWPARHNSGNSTVSTRPPMGARFRLKASYNIPANFNPATQVILRAMKKYGMVLADGGSDWFFTGVSDTNWPDAVFSEIGTVAGSNFEVVDTAPMLVDVNSAATVQPPDTTIPRLVNISTRMQVLTGNDVLIGGFVIGGATPKTVVVRARGPSLASAGIANPLANPVLQLFSGSTQIDSNDNYTTAANLSTLTASGYAPGNPLEAAIYRTLSPGAYTAIVTGSGATTGVGLIEVFEVDHPEIPLVNIATRGRVLTGNDVMIGGFIIQGSGPQTVVVRARGPSLTAQGVPGALANPVLQLYDATTTLIASNDDWGSASNAAAISSSGFAPGNALESAILITLQPGAYTAVVSGAGGTTGVGIIEVFAQ